MSEALLSPPKRILLTGAAGRLGQALREPLARFCTQLRSTDVHEPKSALHANEEFVACDLADAQGVLKLVEGVDAIVHMGGASTEFSADAILRSNVNGTFNLYHAALTQGVRRVVLASSNHVTGYYPVDQIVSTTMPMRPDSLYAVSKGFSELLASYYFDHQGIETLAIRIGTCFSMPTSRRALACWLSFADLARLVKHGLVVPDLHYAVVYGVSGNPASWWRDSDSARLGFTPQDNAEHWRAEIEASTPPHSGNERSHRYQGGIMVGFDYRRPQQPDGQA